MEHQDKELELSRSNAMEPAEQDGGQKGKKIHFRAEDIRLETPYYYTVSNRYKIAKFVVLVILVVFLLSMLSAFRDEITVENFRYMIKYLDTTTNEYEGDYSTIYHNAAGSGNQAVYKGDLAVVSGGGLGLYSMSGLSDLSVSFQYSVPRLLSSDKYLMTYDFFGNSYALYNPFSELYSETMPHPISNAVISDSGLYAIVSKTDEYRSAVFFYDASFEQISQILKEKYVMDVDINKEGSMAVIVSAYNENGDFMCEIMAVNPYEDHAAATVTYADTIPLKVGFNAAGGYAVVTDSALYFYDANHNNLSLYAYGGITPARYHIGDRYTAIVLNQNVVVDENRIVFFDENGRKVFEGYTKGEIADLITDDRYAYLAFDGSVMKIDLITGEQGECAVEKNCGQLLLSGSDKLLLCYNGYATSIDNTSETFGMSAPETEADTGE